MTISKNCFQQKAFSVMHKEYYIHKQHLNVQFPFWFASLRSFLLFGYLAFAEMEQNIDSNIRIVRDNMWRLS